MTPALFTRMSTRPHVRQHGFDDLLARGPGRPRRPDTPWQCRRAVDLRDQLLGRVLAAAVDERDLRPFRANAWTIARPMPRLPPVTSATWSFRHHPLSSLSDASPGQHSAHRCLPVGLQFFDPRPPRPGPRSAQAISVPG